MSKLRHADLPAASDEPVLPLISLNAAAARIAAAHGFSVFRRETLEPGSGRLEVYWSLMKGDASAYAYSLQLFCQPPIFSTGHGGWSGWYLIQDPFGVTLDHVSLVSFDEGLAGRAGRAQTREAFRRRGAKLPAPGAPVKASPSTGTVRPKKKRSL